MGRRVNLATLASEPDVTSPATPGPARQLGERRTVAVATVVANPLNARPPGFDDEIAGMAQTIRELGVIQPLLVCTAAAFLAAYPDQRDAVGSADWVALIGCRRAQAARLAGLADVDVIVNDERVHCLHEVMLVENGQRRALPPWLEAEAMAEALRRGGISQAELARRIGKTPPYVTQRLALLRLVAELRALLEAGLLTIEQARRLADLPADRQRAIAAAGPPYSVNGVNGRARARTIRIGATPAAAAESIRAQFDAAELAVLVQLLSTVEPGAGS